MPRTLTTHDDYPAAADVSEFLSSCEVPADVISELDIESALDAAIEDFEAVAGAPLLIAEDAPATTRRFDPPRAYTLYLAGCLTAAPDSVVVEVRADDEGEPLEERRDYFLEPSNALQMGEPFTRIIFHRAQYGAQQSIEVTGRWGYGTAMKNWLWRALIAATAEKLYPAMSAAVERKSAGQGGQIKAKETPEGRIEYTTASEASYSKLTRQQDEWTATAQAAKTRLSGRNKFGL